MSSAITVSTNPFIESLNVVNSGDSVTIYLSPGGSDSGTGSLESPFATLSRAWQRAQEYTIYGDGVLYVTFLGGTYSFTDSSVPSNLYHPQGSNIIIQGDPSAIKQRYLWRVKDYSWDISNISAHGHTGTVNLTTLTALNNDASGHTHGYSASDTNGWAVISNPSISSHGNSQYSYWDSTKNVYWSGLDVHGGVTASDIYANMFFNHGYSYEGALAALGLVQILDATSTTDLKIAFKTANFDPRVPVFAPHTPGSVSSGVGNSTSWHGVASNYPSNRLNDPSGFYGEPSGTVWGSDGSNQYPSKSSLASTDRHISDQPFLMTNFPVVIEKSGKKPIFSVTNGTIRAIQNIMGVAQAYASPNISEKKTKSLSGLFPATSHLNPDADTTSWFSALLQVENSKVGIRHLGVYHAEAGVQATNSTVYTYSPSNLSAAWGSGSEYSVAALGSISNTPVLTAYNVKRAVNAYGSKVELGYEPGADRGVSETHTVEQGCYIQHSYNALNAENGSAVSVRGAVISSVSQSCLPIFSFQVRVPVFSGATAAASTQRCFVYPPVWGGSESSGYYSGFQNTYNGGAVLFKRGSTGITLGYIVSIGGGGTYAEAGQYSVTYDGGAVTPQYWQTLNIWGYRAGSATGLTYCFDGDIRNNSVIGLGTSGNTLEFVAFSANNESGLTAGKLEIGYRAVSVHTAGGTAYIGTTTGSADYPVVSYSNVGSVWNQNNGNSTVRVSGNSSLTVRKHISIVGGEESAICVQDRSVLLAGANTNSTSTNPSRTSAVLLNGCGVYGILCQNNSVANIGTLLVKNGKGQYGTGELCASVGVHCTDSSRVNLCDPYGLMVMVFAPVSTTGAWTANTQSGNVAVGSVVYGNQMYQTVLEAQSNSTIQKAPGYVIVSAFDGGSVQEQTGINNTKSLGFYKNGYSSTIGGFSFIGSTSDSNASASRVSHIWAANTGTVMTRGNWKYGVATGNQYYQWWKTSGTKPSTGGGRTAGVWSTSGENVRKVGWGMIAEHALSSSSQLLVSTGKTTTGGLTYAGVPVGSSPYSVVGASNALQTTTDSYIYSSPASTTTSI